MIVDAQVHIWVHSTPQRPWVPGVTWAPQLGPLSRREDFTADDLLREMDEAGVDGAVLVPPGALEGYRNDLALEAVRRNPQRFAAMGQVDFRLPDARERLEELLVEPRMRGMRISLPGDNSGEPFHQRKMGWVFQMIEQSGKPLMLYAPEDLDLVEEIAQKHPTLEMALCHMALLRQDAGKPVTPRIEPLVKLARYPNIAVKATALSMQSQQPFPFADVHEALQRTLEAYGPERVFWGTDMTRLACSYRESKEFFFAMPFLKGRDRELVMGEALKKWLRWK